MIKKISKILKGIDSLSEYSAKLFSFLVLAIVALQTMEVVLRYGFKSPTDWSWELGTLLTGVSFMMGGAWVLKEQKHVRTDIFYGRLSKKWKAILDVIFFGLLFTPFMGVLIWKSIQNTIYSWQIDERTFSMWGPSIAPSKTIFTIAIILLALQGIAKLTRDVIFIVKGEEV